MAVALGSGTGLALILLLFPSATVITGLALAVYPVFRAGIEMLHDRIVGGRATFTAFLISLVVLPVLLLLLRGSG